MFSIRPSKKLSGQYQDLKYRVQRAMQGRGNLGFVLTFVSYEHNEGVTSVAANFAATLAQDIKKRVLLIDANLASPSLQGLLEENPRKAGDAAAAHIEEPNLLWRITSVNKNLDIGMVHNTQNNPVQIFESSWFNNRLRSIRDRYGCVIIDSPPIKDPSGALVLTTKADAVILVIEAGRVRREVLQRAVTVLTETGAQFLGVVLNKRRYPIPRFIYKFL